MSTAQRHRGTGRRHFLALLRYALPYRRAVALQLSLMAISVGFGLLKPWPLKVLIDNVAADQPFALGRWIPEFSWQALLLLACAAHLLFHAGEALIQVMSGWIATSTSSRMIRDLRSDLLQKLQQLSLRFHDSNRVGDLVHRVTWNSTAVETAFQSGFMGTVKSIIMLVGMFVVMMMINVTLTIIALAVVPLLVILIRAYAKRTHRVALEHQTQEGSVSSMLQEILSGIRLVKASNQEGNEHQRFSSNCDRSVGTRLRSTMVQNSFGFFTALILAAGTALLFWAGIREVRAGHLSIGQFLVFVSYLGMLYSPLSVLSYTASSVQSALGGASRLFEILETPEEVPDPPDPRELAAFNDRIVYDQVTFAYTEGRPVLHDVSFEVQRGETVAIVGETGSGKSTVLGLALRFYDPQAGSIRIDGVDLREMRAASARSLIALAPQDTLLLSGTIADNIAYGRPNATRQQIEQAATLACAHDFIRECEQGYDTVVGERGVRLSMGQRQRISLARVFLRDAPILLLDEPTSAIDAETEALIVGQLSNMRDKAIVIVAHRLSTIRFADRIIVMGDGRVLEAGTHENLLQRRGAYHRLWSAQVSGYEEASV
jgi:ATP-binding cassette subfamily B protein